MKSFVCFLFLIVNLLPTAFADNPVHIPQDLVKLKKILKNLNPTLDTREVRRIYEYSCDRTFFEGEGVTPHSITCPAYQRLGVISSKYHFYLYQSDSDTNFPAFTTSSFNHGICNRTDFLRLYCENSVPEKKFGLYRQSVAPFFVAVTLTKAPEGENITSNYGYAALLNADGSCPEGLVPIRAFRADPESIFMNDPSLGGDNPPSSFVNTNAYLSDVRVGERMLEAQPVYRQKNKERCEGNPPRLGENAGSCRNATFAEKELVRSAAYKSLNPVVCALPPEIL